MLGGESGLALRKMFPLRIKKKKKKKNIFDTMVPFPPLHFTIFHPGRRAWLDRGSNVPPQGGGLRLSCCAKGAQEGEARN